MSLRIAQIHITDTFGTKSAKFSPRSVTRITGPNGSGKSSVLRALARIFEGGSDPSIIRHGAERSVVEIELTDGTKITRTCAPKKRRRADAPVEYSTNLEIIQPDGTPRPAPQTYIASLSEAVAVDPGQILRIDVTTAPGRKQLADILLRIMPIQFTPEEIAAALVRPEVIIRDQHGLIVPSNVKPFDPAALSLPAITGPLDLDGLRKYVGQVTEQRRRIGITRDEASGAASRLRQALPDDDGTDYADALKQAEAYRLDVERAIGARKLEIETQSKEALAAAEGIFRDAKDAINAEIDAKIKALEVERHARTAEAQQVRDVARDAVLKAQSEEIGALTAEAQPVIDKANADIATYKERLTNTQRARFQREEIDRQQATYAEAGTKYDLLTEALKYLDSLRADKLQSLPIPGLVVEGDRVLLNGTDWQNVNTAKRVEVALQLCTLRSGDLPLLFLDDAEHLTTETREMLEQGIAEAGWQLIEAIVTDTDELKIETFDHDGTLAVPMLK
jgi:energy-coupling factor transporter ATP-binding protein EcfA2